MAIRANSDVYSIHSYNQAFRATFSDTMRSGVKYFDSCMMLEPKFVQTKFSSVQYKTVDNVRSYIIEIAHGSIVAPKTHYWKFDRYPDDIGIRIQTLVKDIFVEQGIIRDHDITMVTTETRIYDQAVNVMQRNVKWL